MQDDRRCVVSGQAESRGSREKEGRRPYQTPQLARVNLEAEEVLAIGCKTPHHSVASGAAINCIVRQCAAAGS
jgi:hypothetical protein